MLACYRYIELNPVRAGMVRYPRDYRWSNFHANGDGKADRFVVPHEQYVRIAREEQARRQAYRALFRAHMDVEMVADIRQAATSGGRRQWGAGLSVWSPLQAVDGLGQRIAVADFLSPEVVQTVGL